MSRLICFLSLALLTQQVLAQSTLSVGDKAPSLKITDWLANAPTDKSVEGRPIVIDFWATWCGPCIEAVPHFNELRNEFVSNEDLLFLSMSDESPDKIKRSFKRIDFQSTVVTDQSRDTHKAYAINAIPITYLIDKAGVIQWIGTPGALTADMIDSFLAGEPLTQVQEEETDEEESETTNAAPSEQDFTAVFGLLKNKDIHYLFKVSKTEDPTAFAIKSLPKAYFQMGAPLGVHLSELWDIGEVRIEGPADLLSPLYNLSYINRAKLTKEEALQEIKDQVLRSLGLKMMAEEREATVYQLEVTDASLLEKSDGEMSGVSDAGDQKVFTKQNIGAMLTELEMALGLLFEDKTELTDSYDFLLTQSNLDGLKTSLASYGLKLRESKQMKTFYRLERIDQ